MRYYSHVQSGKIHGESQAHGEERKENGWQSDGRKSHDPVKEARDGFCHEQQHSAKQSEP